MIPSTARATLVRCCFLALLACIPALCAAPAGGAVRLGEAEKTVLPNGMTVLAAQNADSDITAVDLFLRVDALREPRGREGVRALLQFLVASQMQEKLKAQAPPGRMAQALNAGAQLDASTDVDFVEFYSVTTTDALDDLLALFRDAFAPDISADAFGNARKAALTAVDRQRSDAVEGAYELFRKALDPRSKAGMSMLGTPETIGALTLDDVKAFQRRWYVPRSAVLAVVSPLEPNDIAVRVGKAFGGIRAGSRPGTWRPRPAAGIGSRLRAEGNPRIAAASIVVGWPAPGLGSQGHEAAIVAAAVLGEGDESRLAQDKTLQESRDLGYMQALFTANPNTILAGVGGDGHIAVQTEAAVWAIDDVKNCIVAQVQRLVSDSVPPDELAAAKRRAVNAFALQHQTARAQAFSLGRYEALGLGYGFRSGLQQRIEAVTAADVQQMAQTYFTHGAIGAEMPLVDSPDIAGSVGFAPLLPPARLGIAQLLQEPE